MTIKFICSCGKHLRARDEMAMRRSACPRCGLPVGIPSREPTVPGAPQGPMTPQERRRLARQRGASEDSTAPLETAFTATDPGLDLKPPKPLDPEDVRPPGEPPADAKEKKPRRRRSQEPLEKHWYQSLGFPVRSLHWVLLLALLWTGLSGLTLVMGPLVVGSTFHESPSIPTVQITVGVCCFLIAFVLGGYACGFLQGVLVAAIQGEGKHVPWPGRNLKWVTWSAGLWLLAFLAGPIIPAAGAVVYWVRAGDLGVLDWAIVGELGVLAMGYWLLAILAATRRGRYRDGNPFRVVELVGHMGGSVLLVVGIMAVLAVVHGVAILVFMQRLHDSLFNNVFQLFVCWGNLLFWTTGLFRLLGVWCHRSPWFRGDPVAAPAPEPAATTGV